MAIAVSNAKTEVGETEKQRLADDQQLESDERWLLVQRIVASEGFQRAAQLRNILLYTSRHALLHPSEPIREHDIAQAVLGRKADFDPGSDNIVRVQVSHLRRRLAHYFESEGANEPLRLTLLKGSYLPTFASQPLHREQPGSHLHEAGSPIASERLDVNPGWRRRELLLASFCALLVVLVAFLLVQLRSPRSSAKGMANTPALADNPFLAPLLANGQGISIVLSDTSLNVMQNLLHVEVDVPTYMAGFGRQLLTGVQDTKEREALASLASKRSTNFGEATVSALLYARLSSAGSRTEIRYARDLHVRDFDEHNVVVLGSRRSNPWALMFTDGSTYQYQHDPLTGEYSFFNTKPHPGQQTRFVPDITQKPRMESYVDLSVGPNLTNTGSVLLVNGSDMQATESAVRFVLAGSFPEALQNALRQAGKRPFEVFMRSHHSDGDSNGTLELLDVRLR